MKRPFFLLVALALSTVTNLAQTTPATAPVATAPPSRPAGAISGFTPNAVSGFTPGAVSGFNQNPVSGFTPIQKSPFQPGNIAPLSTPISGVGTNNLNAVPANPNTIVVPQSQQPVGVVPADTNQVLLEPLF